MTRILRLVAKTSGTSGTQFATINKFQVQKKISIWDCNFK